MHWFSFNISVIFNFITIPWTWLNLHFFASLYLYYLYYCRIDIHLLRIFTCRGGLGDDEQLAFRKWFRHIGELRSMFPSANLLAISATCNKEIRRTVMKELGLQKECTTMIIRSPDKSNIKYYVKKN